MYFPVAEAGWLGDLTAWLLQQVKDFWQTIYNYFQDYIVWGTHNLLSLVSLTIDSIPVPSFLTGNSIGGYLGSSGPTVLYFLAVLQIPAGFALVAAGFAFRLLRKLVTLGQW